MDQNRMELPPKDERLEELLDVQKKMLRHTRIITWFNLLLGFVLLAAVVLTIRWTSAKIDHVEDSLTAIDKLVDDASVLIDNGNTLIDSSNTLIVNSNELVTENADTVEETLQKLNEVDIEGLNEAIDSLNKAIQPLTRLAGIFQ